MVFLKTIHTYFEEIEKAFTDSSVSWHQILGFNIELIFTLLESFFPMRA